jgi:hypothetical protein
VRNASATRDDSKIWVAGGGNERVCLLRVEAGQDGPASQCLPPDWVAEGKQILTTEFSDDDIAVAGVLPDDVSAALLVLKDGRTLTVPVVGNVYRARVDSGVRSVSFTASDGKPVTYMLDGTA